MPASCAVVGCSKRRERDGQVSFFRVPAVLKGRGEKLNALSRERRETWVRSLKHGNLSETYLKNARICSEHFVQGFPAQLTDRNHVDWAPTVNMGYTILKAKNRRATKKLIGTVQGTNQLGMIKKCYIGKHDETSNNKDREVDKAKITDMSSNSIKKCGSGKQDDISNKNDQEVDKAKNTDVSSNSDDRCETVDTLDPPNRENLFNPGNVNFTNSRLHQLRTNPNERIQLRTHHWLKIRDEVLKWLQQTIIALGLCRSWAAKDSKKDLSFQIFLREKGGKLYIEIGRDLVERSAWMIKLGIGKPSVKRMKEKLQLIFDNLSYKLRTRPDIYLPAIQAFTKKYKSFTTDSEIISSLYNFGRTIKESSTSAVVYAPAGGAKMIRVRTTVIPLRRSSASVVNTGRPNKQKPSKNMQQ